MNRGGVMIRFASTMATLTTIGIAASVTIGPVVWLFFIEWAAAAVGFRVQPQSFSIDLKLAGASIALLGGLIRAFGLVGLRRTFVEAASDRPLSERAVIGFRRFARVELLMVPVRIVQLAAFGYVVSLADGVEGGSIPISLGTQDVGAFFIALLLVFAAEVFAEGRLAVEENASFL